MKTFPHSPKALAPLRGFVSAFLVGLLSVGIAVSPLDANTQPAFAVDAGGCSEASGTMVCNVQGSVLDFTRLGSLTTTVGQSAVATNVFTGSGVQIDARVTVTQVVSGGTLSKSSRNLSVSIGTNQTVGFRLDFFVNGIGSSALLRNVEILVTDIDGDSQNERAEFSGLASYTLTNDTRLTADPAGTPTGDAETGTRVFKGGVSNDSDGKRRSVSVLFAESSSIGLKAFSEGSGGVIGFEFGPPNWGGSPTTTVAVGSGSYTVTYDTNAGDVAAPDSTTGRGDLTLSAGTGMSKSGIPISSWNTAPDGSGVGFALGTTYRPIANLTLYAQYETQRVTFDANATVTGTTAPQDAAGPTALTVNGFQRDGFRFAGWNTVADGSGTAYADGAIFPFSTNRTLYAQWTRELICNSLSSFDADDFIVLEDAVVAGSKVTLTPDANTQKGGFWSKSRVSLASDFCVSAEVYLGSNDAGADGLALVLQSVNSESLTSGGGLGYAGINPSFAVEIDTFTNTGDPSSDHIALMKDGNTAVHDAWGPGPVSLPNVEDGKWRLLTLEWDASAGTATVYFDNTARFDGTVVNLPTYFASSGGSVYWGFTAATGGARNLQEVRNIEYSAAPRSNAAPQFVSGATNRTVLRGVETDIVVGISDDSTTQAQWVTSVSVANNDVFVGTPTFETQDDSSAVLSFETDPTELGSSLVTLTITDADGVSTTTTFTITVAAALPAPAPAASPPPPVVPPFAALQPPRVLPRLVEPPAPVSGPVQRVNPSAPAPAQPTATLGGRPATIQTQVTDPNTVNLRAGVLSLGVSVQQNQGAIRQGPGGATELEVSRGGSTTMQGSGLLPGSTVQVFLPFNGSNSREIAQIPVSETGTFQGDAVFGATPTERPLPIGRHVLQVVTIDENRQQAVVEMTINIAQPAPTPEVDRTQGVAPTLRPGQSIATNGGEPELVTVIPNSGEKSATVQGDGWSMAVQVGGDAGGVEPGADGGAAVTFVRDQGAIVSGNGFMPGTRADVWLFSDPTLLGSVQIDDTGAFNGEVMIDGNVITAGEHTLQLQGVGEDGFVRAANLGVSVEDAAGAVTTEEAAGFLWWLWAMVGLGVVVLGAGGAWWYRRANR